MTRRAGEVGLPRESGLAPALGTGPGREVSNRRMAGLAELLQEYARVREALDERHDAALAGRSRPSANKEAGLNPALCPQL